MLIWKKICTHLHKWSANYLLKSKFSVLQAECEYCGFCCEAI